MNSPKDNDLTKKMVDAMKRLVPLYDVIAGKQFADVPDEPDKLLIGEGFHNTFISDEFKHWCEKHNVVIEDFRIIKFMYTGDCVITFPDQETKLLFILRWS